MIKEIKYSGFTATPSDYQCLDGELDAAINLVPEDGELHPVQEGEVYIDVEALELDGNYKPIYIHKNSAPQYKHIILINSDTGSVIWLDEESNDTELCEGELVDTGIKDVISIGNTLVFISEEATHFTLWDDNEQDYVYLGTKMPELPISFGLQAYRVDKFESFDVGEMNNTFMSHNALEGIHYDSTTGRYYFREPVGIPSGMIDFFDNKIKGIVNSFMAEYGTNKDKFCLPFFVRYAFRLKGDKGWINRSSPVLMIPCMMPECMINDTEQDDTSVEIITSMNVRTTVYFAQLDYEILGNVQGQIDSINKWGDVIEAVDIFVSPPIYLYNPNGKIGQIIPAYSWGGSIDNVHYYWPDYYHVPRMTISRHDDNGTIVNGSIVGVSYSQFYEAVEDTTAGKNRFFAFWAKTEEEIRDAIVNENRFYRVASIKLKDLTTGRHVVEIEDGALQSLAGRKQLDEEGAAHDHNTYAYGGGFTYNSRLLFYNVKKVSGVTDIHAGTLVPYTNNNSAGSYGNLRLYTAIEKGGEKIYKRKESTTAIISHDGLPVPFIYLPEPAITDIALSYHAEYTNFDGHYNEYKAKVHKFLNGVYLWLGWNNFREDLTEENVANLTTELNGKHIFEYGNELFVSNVNNPFLFSSTNTVDVDAQGIMAVQSAVKALSEGQYGQFPLYVFTEVGVWALEVASDGTFSAVKAVSNDVCINPKSITKLDTSVLFATDRGIMMLSGSNTICMTDSIYSEDEYRLITGDDDTDLLPQLGNLASTNQAISVATDIRPFKTFLPEARMLYDYTHQRIIVYNPDRDYAYIYSLKSKQWGMMESSIQYAINSYPECLAVDAQNRIIDMSAITNSASTNSDSTDSDSTDSDSTDSDSTNSDSTSNDMSAITNSDSTRNCLLVTRPLKLDAPDILKTIDTIIQRGKFRKGSVKSILYGSRDLYNWHLVYSSTDHYLRGFRGTPYKYFRIVLLCDIKKDESLFGATIQYNNRLIDQPR